MNNDRKTQNRIIRTRFAAWLGVNLILGIMALIILYAAHEKEILCPIHALFDINCPGCGGRG